MKFFPLLMIVITAAVSAWAPLPMAASCYPLTHSEEPEHEHEHNSSTYRNKPQPSSSPSSSSRIDPKLLVFLENTASATIEMVQVSIGISLVITHHFWMFLFQAAWNLELARFSNFRNHDLMDIESCNELPRIWPRNRKANVFDFLLQVHCKTQAGLGSWPSFLAIALGLLHLVVWYIMGHEYRQYYFKKDRSSGRSLHSIIATMIWKRTRSPGPWADLVPADFVPAATQSNESDSDDTDSDDTDSNDDEDLPDLYLPKGQESESDEDGNNGDALAMDDTTPQLEGNATFDEETMAADIDLIVEDILSTQTSGEAVTSKEDIVAVNVTTMIGSILINDHRITSSAILVEMEPEMAIPKCSDKEIKNWSLAAAESDKDVIMEQQDISNTDTLATEQHEIPGPVESAIVAVHQGITITNEACDDMSVHPEDATSDRADTASTPAKLLLTETIVLATKASPCEAITQSTFSNEEMDPTNTNGTPELIEVDKADVVAAKLHLLRDRFDIVAKSDATTAMMKVPTEMIEQMPMQHQKLSIFCESTFATLDQGTKWKLSEMTPFGIALPGRLKAVVQSEESSRGPSLAQTNTCRDWQATTSTSQCLLVPFPCRAKRIFSMTQDSENPSIPSLAQSILGTGWRPMECIHQQKKFRRVSQSFLTKRHLCLAHISDDLGMNSLTQSVIDADQRPMHHHKKKRLNSLSRTVLPPTVQPPLPQEIQPEKMNPSSRDAIVVTYHPHQSSQTLVPVHTQKNQQDSPAQVKARNYKDYMEYISEGRIHVNSLNTCQGRKLSSTNGCTVISALCAAYHINDTPNISNDTIEWIIDEACGLFLQTIRSTFDLDANDFIVPSDVHSHLVDEMILHQEKFRGAAGGNVLDKGHIGEFLKLLTEGTGKAAATFFFHAHVISIVKCVDSTTMAVSYDWIDSLPSDNGGGTRTKCTDVLALQTQILHYVNGPLSDDSSYFTPWDDELADLDPRVFQVIHWSRPQPSYAALISCSNKFYLFHKVSTHIQ